MLPEKAIINALRSEFPELEAIYLFGSHANRENRADSDVDLGLLLPHVNAHTITARRLMKPQQIIADICSCDVDLINLRTATTVLAKEVVMNSVLLFCRNRFAVDEFEMHTLSFYQKLNEERREILQEGLAGGRFYGS